MLDEINIVTSIWEPDGKYSMYAGVMIYSILTNSHNKSKLHFHVLHDNTLRNVNKNKLIEMIDDNNAKITFYKVDLPAKLLNCKAIAEFSPGTLFRFFIEKELKTIERVLYLDCDIICRMDISELYNIDISDCSIAAVRDTLAHTVVPNGLPREYSFYKDKDYYTDEYFNAGVMLMNLAKIREKYDFLNDNIAFLTKYNDAPLLDQDALNSMFLEDKKIIDGKYNVFVNHLNDDKTDINNCILHFNNPYNKPWKVKTSRLDIIFWQYLAASPWGMAMPLPT